MWASFSQGTFLSNIFSSLFHPTNELSLSASWEETNIGGTIVLIFTDFFKVTTFWPTYQKIETIYKFYAG